MLSDYRRCLHGHGEHAGAAAGQERLDAFHAGAVFVVGFKRAAVAWSRAEEAAAAGVQAAAATAARRAGSSTGRQGSAAATGQGRSGRWRAPSTNDPNVSTRDFLLLVINIVRLILGCVLISPAFWILILNGVAFYWIN